MEDLPHIFLGFVNKFASYAYSKPRVHITLVVTRTDFSWLSTVYQDERNWLELV